MIRFLMGLFALLSGFITTPIMAQTVTVTAPLPDKDGDGHVTVTSMAAKLGVSRGTVLTRCADTLVYVGPKTSCPAGANPSAVRAPVAPRDITPVVTGPWAIRAPVAPRDVTPIITDAHKLKAATIPASMRIADEVGRTRGFVVTTGGAVNGLTIERVAVTCRDTCIHVKRAGSGLIVRDADLSGAGVDTSDGYHAGLKLDSTQSDVLIERVASHGWQSVVPAKYPNSDGFGTERGNARVTFRFTRAWDATDGCYDLKSSETVLDHTYASRCRYDYRLWGSGRGTVVIADSPIKAAIQIKPSTSYVIDDLVLTGSVPAIADIVDDGAGGSLTIKRCSRPVTTRVAPNTKLVLGVSCLAAPTHGDQH